MTMDNATVRKFLDLSTQHLPMEMGANDLNGEDGVVAYPTDHGWLLWVPDEPDESNDAMSEPVPDVVLNIQRYARARGCDYVLFDSDGPRNPDLPQWDW